MRLSARTYRLSAFAVFLVVTACRGRVETQPNTQIAELSTTANAFAESPLRKDANAIAAFYDSAVVVMSPQGRGPVRGVAANRAAWERLFRGGNPVHTMTVDTVVVGTGGDMGYTRGKWTVGVDTPNGRAEAQGEYLAVWRRQNAGWRIVEISAYPFR
jgi:ketosteroid isomerase-like protein